MSGTSSNRKLAIVGGAPDKMLAPFEDPEYDTWMVASAAHDDVYAVDALFEMHHPKRYDHRVEHYQNYKCPFYMLEVDERVHESVEYPLSEIRERFQIKREEDDQIKEVDYFTNSMAYMTALAIDRKYDEIHYHGVMLTKLKEYGYQLPCVEYFIGFARALGIDVIIHGGNMCRADRLYGYWEVELYGQM